MQGIPNNRDVDRAIVDFDGQWVLKPSKLLLSNSRSVSVKIEK